MLTPFPEMVRAVISESILGRSEKKEQIKFHIKNLFEFADPPHHSIDDYPFGGGAGMVLKPEPVFRAYDKILEQLPDNPEIRVVFPTPDGALFNHEKAVEIASELKLELEEIKYLVENKDPIKIYEDSKRLTEQQIKNSWKTINQSSITEF